MRASLCSLALTLAIIVSVVLAESLTCKYSNQANGQLYDLSSLTLPAGQGYELLTDTFAYSINFCQAAAADCPQNAVCQMQLSPPTPRGCGIATASQFSPLYVNGAVVDGLVLKYTDGDQCYASGSARVSILQMTCDPNVKLSIDSVTESPQCTYTFNIRSRNACGASNSNCTFTNSANGRFYDLSAMTRTSSEPDFSYTSDSSTYYVNICGDTKEPCIAGTGSCQQAGGSWISMGSAIGARILPYIPNNNADGVSIIYPNGQLCASTNSPRKTTVNILCDHAAGDGIITSVEENPVCQYTVNMRSAVACGQGASVLSCTYNSPSGARYDLSSMIRAGNQPDYYWSSSSAQLAYFVNVCAPSRSTCVNGTGICQNTAGSPYSCGQYNPTVFSDYPDSKVKGVTISYSKGDACASSVRSTRLLIRCDPKLNTTSGVIDSIIEDPTCTYTVEMRSIYACPTK